MASNLGTVFVELSLDDRVYRQKLSEVLTSSEATAKGIETSWKALGVKNDAAYDAQRRSYENAMTLIKNSTTATANDIVRAEEAKNQKIQALNEQQFGKQTSLISTLRANWIAASVAIGAAMGIAYKAWDFAKIGAEYEEQRGILDNLAAKYKTTSTAIIDSMRKASDGLVADADLMRIALGGIAKGLSPKQLIDLAGAAEILGDAIGVDAKTALDDLTSALETGRVKGLKNYMGSTLDLATAFGGLEGKMTAVEKAQAMFNIVMVQATTLQKEQGKEVDTTADKMEKMEASYKNATLALGTMAKNVIATTFDIIQMGIAFSSTEAAIKNKEKALTALTGGVSSWTIQGKTATDVTKEHTKAITAGSAEIKAAVQPYQNQIDLLKKDLASRKDTEAAMKAGAATQKKAAAEIIASQREVEREEKNILTSMTAANKEHYELAIQDSDKWVIVQKSNGENELNFALTALDKKEVALNQWYADQRKAIDAHVGKESEKNAKLKALDAEYNKAWNGFENQREVKTVEVIEFQKKAKSSFIDWDKKQQDDLLEYERNQGGKRQNISADTWDKIYQYQRLTGIKINADQALYVDQMLIDYKDTFAGGVKSAFTDLKNRATSWGDTSYAVVSKFATDSEKQLSDNLFSVMKGNFDQVGIDWASLWDGMLQTLSNQLSKMAVEAAASVIELTFNAVWDAAAAATINMIGNIVGNVDWASYSDAFDFSDSAIGGFAKGGYVGGGPAGSDDSFTNDTVLAGVSPGEFMVPRSVTSAIAAQGQRGDTMLAHINPVEARLLTALGGAGTINSRTGLPQFDNELIGSGFQTAAGREMLRTAQPIEWQYKERDEWGALIGDPTIYEAGMSRQQVISRFSAAMNAGKRIQVLRDGSNGIYDTYFGNAVDGYQSTMLDDRRAHATGLGYFTRPLTEGWGEENVFADAVHAAALIAAAYALAGGAPAAAGGTGAGGGAGAGAGAAAAEFAPLSAYTWGGASAASPYTGAWAAGTGAAGLGGYGTATAGTLGWGVGAGYAPFVADASLGATAAWGGSSLADKIGQRAYKYARNKAIKAAINKVTGGLYGGSSNGKMSVKYGGADDHGLLASLSDSMSEIAPKSHDFSFSARNGIDYVPRDNFPIRAHEGEAVLTKKENAERKGGGAIIYNFNLYATYADRNAVNELAEQIYPRLSKLAAWGH